MTSLEEEVQQLKIQVAYLLSVIQAAGLNNPWKTPTEAAALLGESAEMIRRQIRYARQFPKSSKLKQGTHYKFKGKHYLVNIEEWKKLQVIAPEYR